MIKVAVTNLHAYLGGNLVFEWLDVPFDENELKDVFHRIGSNQYFISDYESESLNIKIEEHVDLNDLNDLCEQVFELSGYELRELKAILEVHSISLDEGLEMLNEGDFIFYDVESMEELAQMLVDEGCFGEIPNTIENYIDYEKIARDLEFDGYTKTSQGIIFFN